MAEANVTVLIGKQGLPEGLNTEDPGDNHKHVSTCESSDNHGPLVFTFIAWTKLLSEATTLDQNDSVDRIDGASSASTYANIRTSSAAVHRTVAGSFSHQFSGSDCTLPRATDDTIGEGLAGSVARAAYVAFTSGTTGWPKGVAVSQAGLLAFVHGRTKVTTVTPGEKMDGRMAPST